MLDVIQATKNQDYINLIMRRNMFKYAMITMICLFFAGLQTVTAQTKWGLPGSPTGRALDALLTVIDRGEEAQIRQFVETKFAPSFLNQFPIKQHIEIFLQLHKDLPGLNVGDVRKTGPQSAQAILKSTQNNNQFKLVVEIEQEAPYRYVSIGFEPQEAVKEVAYSTPKELDRYLKEQTADGLFSGVVLIAKNGKPVFEKAYGWVNKKYKVPNKIDTKFNIGSLNKFFTGVAVLQLVEKGALHLDDPLSKHLSAFPQDIADKITIRYLLQHKAGWGAYWENDYYLAFIKDIPVDFEPGTRQQYSNTGYEVLGMVIEKVTGQSYYDYVRENVYKSAGMTGTDAYEKDGLVENLATGYTNHAPPRGKPGEGFQRENSLLPPAKGTAAGGGYSTAGDLLKFINAFRSFKLLSPKYTAMVNQDYEDVEHAPRRLRGGIGMAGGGQGINAVLEIEYGPGDIVIVLSNYDPPTASKLGGQIMRTLVPNIN